MIKKLIGIVVALVVILIIAVVVLATVFGGKALNAFAKYLIEEEGSRALGVETTVDSVSIGLSDGTLDLTDLRIDNPDGFNTDNFITLADGGFRVEPSSLRQETITIPELNLSGIALNLERAGTSSNYQVILDNLKQFEGGGEPSASESARTYIINQITIEEVDVTARLLGTGNAALDDATEVRLDIPLIELSDVGSAGDPITTAELVSLVVKTLIEASIEVGDGVLPTEILTDLQSRISGLLPIEGLDMSSLEDLGKSVEDAAGKAIDDAKKNVEDAAKDAIDDLFNRDKDDNDGG